MFLDGFIYAAIATVIAGKAFSSDLDLSAVMLGLFLGVAIGGDYSIGSPLLGEFTPVRKRGNCLGLLEILWNVGAYRHLCGPRRGPRRLVPGGSDRAQTPPAHVTVICFFGYLLFYGFMSILPGIYPLEVFPTAVRLSGEGVASAASRIGAAVGTFLLPVTLSAFGLPPVLLALALVCLVGAVTSVMLAPETAGKSLSETGSRQGTDHRVKR